MSEICQESDMNKPYKKDPQTIQALTELQFSVTQKSATERPFTGEYDDHWISSPVSHCSRRRTNLIRAVAGRHSANQWKTTSAT